MQNRVISVFTILLTICSCKSVMPKSEGAAGVLGPITEVSIGDSRTSVIDKLGPPTSKNTEKLLNVDYEVFEYSRKDGLPIGYINLDRDSGKVVGRAIWVSETQPEQEFSYLQSRMFPHSAFETFITCDKHHADEVKVDRHNGIFVGMQRGHVILVSWADSRLTKLRIDQFFLKCPERQKR